MEEVAKTFFSVGTWVTIVLGIPAAWLAVYSQKWLEAGIEGWKAKRRARQEAGSGC